MAYTPAPHDEQPHVDETTSLLSHNNDRASFSAESVDHDRNSPLYRRVMIVQALVIFTYEIPWIIVLASSTRVFEIIYCHDFFLRNDPTLIGPDGSVPELECKRPQIQSKVSTLNGNRQFFQNLPTIVIAVFVGMLAERIGRRPLLIMNAASLALRAAWVYFVSVYADVIDLRFVWLESILVLFGGGQMAFSALIFMSISDVTSDANKAAAFFFIAAIDQLAAFGGPFIAGALMKFSAWHAFAVGVVLHFTCVAATFALPETLQPRPSGTIGGEGAVDAARDEHPTLKAHAKQALHSLDKTLGFLIRDWRVLVMSSFYLIRMQANTLESQSLQYIAQRYQTSMADASFFQAMQCFCCTVVLFLALPFLANHLTGRAKKPLSPEQKDVFLVRMGLFATGAGWLVIGFAPTLSLLVVGLGVLSLGAGASVAIRAAATAWVKPDEVGRLYGVMAVIETIGLTAGGPAISQIYNAGLQTGQEFWFGLPWVVFAAIMAVTVLFACLVRWVPDERQAQADEVIR